MTYLLYVLAAALLVVLAQGYSWRIRRLALSDRMI